MKLTVTVYLSEDFRATSMGFLLNAPYREAISFDVVAPDALGACEVAYAVCNSYPEEMMCDFAYYDVVVKYREGRNRSLSVGDCVVVKFEGGETIQTLHSCEMAGWKLRSYPLTNIVTERQA